VSYLVGMDGFAAAAARHPEVVREALSSPEPRGRVRALETLARREVDPAPHLTDLVGLAVSPAKKVRSGARMLLARAPEAAEPLLRERAAGGATDERARALALLASLRGAAARPFLSEQAAAETSPKVKKALAELLATAAEPGAAGIGEKMPDALAFPPLAPPVPRPVGAFLREAIAAFLEASHNRRLAMHGVLQAHLHAALQAHLGAQPPARHHAAPPAEPR
jgi:hypothetical protein